MKRFLYVFDPLCLGTQGLYVVNRWCLKPFLSRGFLHSHFNDLLLVPAALPLVLYVQRRLGLRSHDAAPTMAEIIFHTLLWSVICEALGPVLFHRGTADLKDVFAYGTGAALAWMWWKWR